MRKSSLMLKVVIQIGVTMKHFLILILAIPSFSFAGKVVREKAKVQVFKNRNCQSTDSCGLKSFKVESYNYGAHFSKTEVSYGTGMYASFKTQSVNDLEDYAVVQYIKGCKFESYKNTDGSISKRIAEKREFFDEIVDFIHEDWVLDSVDLDPVYNSHKQGRHLVYRWNHQQNTRADHIYLYSEYPKVPFLYVRDFPGTVSVSSLGAKNISLQFKTCIFKSKDVPYESTPSGFGTEKALKCFEWDSSHIYNFKNKKYERRVGIDPFCKSANR